MGFISAIVGEMKRKDIRFNQRVIFHCRQDDKDHRGTVMSIDDSKETADIMFYDGRYTAKETVDFSNIIEEDDPNKDIRSSVSG